MNVLESLSDIQCIGLYNKTIKTHLPEHARDYKRQIHSDSI